MLAPFKFRFRKKFKKTYYNRTYYLNKPKIKLKLRKKILFKRRVNLLYRRKFSIKLKKKLLLRKPPKFKLVKKNVFNLKVLIKKPMLFQYKKSVIVLSNSNFFSKLLEPSDSSVIRIKFLPLFSYDKIEKRRIFFVFFNWIRFFFCLKLIKKFFQIYNKDIRKQNSVYFSILRILPASTFYLSRFCVNLRFKILTFRLNRFFKKWIKRKNRKFYKRGKFYKVAIFSTYKKKMIRKYLIFKSRKRNISRNFICYLKPYMYYKRQRNIRRRVHSVNFYYMKRIATRVYKSINSFCQK
jgi:hypothetical protein